MRNCEFFVEIFGKKLEMICFASNKFKLSSILFKHFRFTVEVSYSLSIDECREILNNNFANRMSRRMGRYAINVALKFHYKISHYISIVERLKFNLKSDNELDDHFDDISPCQEPDFCSETGIFWFYDFELSIIKSFQ